MKITALDLVCCSIFSSALLIFLIATLLIIHWKG